MPDKTRVEIEKEHFNCLRLDKTGRMQYTHPLPVFFHEYVAGVLGDVRNKIVLELGCGGGENLMKLASQGAVVYGIDISKNVIEHCNMLVSKSPFAGRIDARIGDIQAMEFPDEFFDIIYGHCVLHHLDLEAAVAEIYRCLKKDGKGIFVEPLGHNLFVRLFRKFTPHIRTTAEKPILFSDYKIFSRKFSLKTREFFLLSVIAFIPGMLGLDKLFEQSMDVLYKIEQGLKLDTLFRKQCGYVVLEFKK
jgi:SAM-dependent methyltransferase